MINKIYIYGTLLFAFVFTACSSDDETNYMLDDEGYVKVTNPITEDEFRSKAYGKWREIEECTLNKDGSLETVKYPEIVGNEYTHLEIQKDLYIIRIEHDWYTNPIYRKYTYNYNSTNNSLYVEGERTFQILSVTNDRLIILTPGYPRYSQITLIRDDGTTPDIETIDYNGFLVPYEPLEEKDMPEWLRELMQEKEKNGLYRICVGTLNNQTIYNLNSWWDSSSIGHFYDENGNNHIIYNIIPTSNDLVIFLSEYQNVKCIYYRSSPTE